MDLRELSDEALLAEYRTRPASKRTDVVDALFARHYERVARWCLRFAGDREAAADLAQDVFLKAHRHLDSFKGTAQFSTWLYSIVRNEWLNRRQRMPPPSEDESVLDEIPSLDPGPAEAALRQDLAGHIRTLLSETLDERERTIFTLHYGDDMTLDAITRLLRLDNSSGAKAYVVSARRKLARAVQRLRARGAAL
jgi:RNA polymerase sigma-70 factor (ECF subfamily)